MANIKMNITELRRFLNVMPAEHNIMLVGEKGVGKSELLTEYFTAKGMKVIPLFLGQLSDPGDLIGLPCKDEATGRTDFMPPYWFPVDGKPIVLFLDELNRARPELLQTVFDLCLNRKLAGRMLPEGSRVISAVNAGENYQVTDLDPALVSRFNIIHFKPTVEEWLLWARKIELDERVLRFIAENPFWLDGDPDAETGEDTGLDKNPDRRAWKRVSDILKNSEGEETDMLAKYVSAVIGAKAASAFIACIAKVRLVSAAEVLKNFEKTKPALEGYQLHQLSVVNESIYRYLEVENISTRTRSKIVSNLEAYFKWLSKQKREAAAHFANAFVKQTYTNAVNFIALHCPNLPMSMTRFVGSIN